MPSHSIARLEATCENPSLVCSNQAVLHALGPQYHPAAAVEPALPTGICACQSTVAGARDERETAEPVQTPVSCGGVSRRRWGRQVGPSEQAAVDAAITSAFMDDSEDAWEALLEATGAADYDDNRAEAPAIDVQHSSTGVVTPSLPGACYACARTYAPCE